MSGPKRRSSTMPALAVLTTLAAVIAGPNAGMEFFSVAYPTGGNSIPNVVGDGTLTRAWADPTPEQFQQDRLTATLYYGGRDTHPGSPVKIAAVNTATLTGAKHEFKIVRVGPAARILATDGGPAPGGGFKVSWHWNVLPLKSGNLHLTLDLEPKLPPGSPLESEWLTVNEPISIPVQVHPRQADLNAVFSTVNNMQIGLSDRLVVGRRSHVTADLPLDGRADTIHAEIDLATDGSSVETTIEPESIQQMGDHLRQSWWVTATRAGRVGLLFEVKLSTAVGEFALNKQRDVPRAATARPPGPSVWSRVASQINWLNTLGAFIITGLSIAAAWLGLQRRRSGVDGAERGGERRVDGSP